MTDGVAASLDADSLLDVYRTMVMSRRLDQRCMSLLREGVPIPHYHSGAGQEALMVAAVAPLRREDTMIYTHRGYGHLLAKGVTMREVLLDMFMKAGGTNNGFGGVMHVCRPDLGVPGREGVFGTRFGIAAGMALAAKLRESADVVLCFYGEAAGSRGALYEALNMAVLWDLPVVLVAENNGWSFSSRTDWLYPKGLMSRVWRGFDIPVAEIDGNDCDAVHGAVADAVALARGGGGPSVIEALTYRMDPHIWWDSADYQPADEIALWRTRDPVSRARSRLACLGVPGSVCDAVEAEADTIVEEAFAAVARAEAASWPDSQRE